MPKRSSLPSRLPTFCSIGRSAKACVGACSNQTAPVIFASRKTSITPKTTAAWRMRPTIRPNIHTQAIGIRMIETVARMFVQKVGFSNGCVQFGPKKPPPFVPSCLMVRNAATGPRAIDLFDAFQRRRVRRAGQRHGHSAQDHERWPQRARAAAAPETWRAARSRKKLPISLRPASPRAIAASAAMPVAAETNCSHIRAHSCER